MSMTTGSASIVYNPPEVNSGTTTSWIPVTTAWPSSSGCATSFFLFPGNALPAGWDPGYGYWVGGTPRCLPPAATTWWEQNHQGGDGFTSVSIRPIVCPAAFTTAATSVQSGSSTLVLCCPSDYPLQNAEPGRAVGACQSPLTPGQTLTFLAQSEAEVVTQTLLINSSTVMNGIAFQGWNVATSTPTSSTLQDCGSLSTGAKAGIGVGSAIGGIGIIALISAFFLFHRRPKNPQYAAVPPLQTQKNATHENPIQYISEDHIQYAGGHSSQYLSGYPDQYIHELGAQPKVMEMPSGN